MSTVTTKDDHGEYDEDYGDGDGVHDDFLRDLLVFALFMFIG